MHRSSRRLCLPAMLAASSLQSLVALAAVTVVASAHADLTVPANGSETLSGADAAALSGNVRLNTASTLVVEDAADAIATPEFAFLGNGAHLRIGPGVTLSGTVNSSVAGGYGANAVSNVLAITGPDTILPSFIFKDGYSQSNQSRGHNGTQVFVTNGVVASDFRWSSKDGRNYSFYFEDASVTMGSAATFGGALGGATVHIGRNAALTNAAGTITLSSPRGRFLVEGDGAEIFASKFDLNASDASFELRNGALATFGSMSSYSLDRARWVISGPGTRLVATDTKNGISLSYNDKNLARDCSVLVEDQACLHNAGPLQLFWYTPNTNNSFHATSGAAVTNNGSVYMGMKSYNGLGGGTNFLFEVDNATFVTKGAFNSHPNSIGNRLRVVDGAYLECTDLNPAGKGFEFLVRNATVSASGNFLNSGWATAEQPAKLVLEGTNAVLVTGNWGPTTGTGVHCDMTFKIDPAGRSTEEPFYRNFGTYQSSYNFPDGVSLHFDIPSAWARSGTDHHIDLIEMTGAKGNFTYFLALAAAVDPAELKGCTLSYVPNRDGKANRMLRLTAANPTGTAFFLR